MTANGYPDNPVLARVWRGEHVESQHRGAWCLVDTSGAVLEGGGHPEAPFFVRSAIKCAQALPLLETGAAERFDFGERELALAVSSHNAEPCHTDVVRRMLAASGHREHSLRCGPQPPGDPEARATLIERGADPGRLHNNCSGKHAGFLALARHLDIDTERYLEPEDEAQRLVRSAVVDLAGAANGDVTTAIDGCSAPTFRFPLSRLATAFARFTSPEGLSPERAAACRRVVEAVARHPVLVAGRHKRLCTALSKVSRGRLFPKIGAEAVYAVGVVGAERALAVKMDDGDLRGLHAVVVALLERFGFLDAAAVERLAEYRQPIVRNWAGEAVGHVEVLVR